MRRIFLIPLLPGLLLLNLLPTNLGLAGAPRAWAEPLPPCPAAPTAALQLPILARALRQGEPVVIAAFGSSSTRGAKASDRAHSYPAILQAELTRRLPGAHIAVINRGVGGEDAARELVRLGRDVAALRPQLVIWQVGANAALRDVDPDSFATAVTAGVHRLREVPADVVLMDNQRAPRVLAAPRHAEIERRVAAVAREQGTGLFSRGALMDAWLREGHDYAQFLAPDNLHQNDLGYRCVALSLAASITASITASIAAPITDPAAAPVAAPITGPSQASSLSRK